MSVHLDYAAENFREAWTNASSDPTTIQSLARGGRALVQVARELEHSADHLARLQQEVEQLRAERDLAVGPRRAILIVRDSATLPPTAIADEGVEIVELDLHAVGGRHGFGRLPAEQRTAWLEATDQQIAAMPEGHAQTKAAALWRELALASRQADDAGAAPQPNLDPPAPDTGRGAGR